MKQNRLRPAACLVFLTVFVAASSGYKAQSFGNTFTAKGVKKFGSLKKNMKEFSFVALLSVSYDHHCNQKNDTFCPVW
jgi:hypothetical protein